MEPDLEKILGVKNRKFFGIFFMFQNDPKRHPKSPTPHISAKLDLFHPFLFPFRSLRQDKYNNRYPSFGAAKQRPSPCTYCYICQGGGFSVQTMVNRLKSTPDKFFWIPRYPEIGGYLRSESRQMSIFDENSQKKCHNEQQEQEQQQTIINSITRAGQSVEGWQWGGTLGLGGSPIHPNTNLPKA